jgi:hypothetical protein
MNSMTTSAAGAAARSAERVCVHSNFGCLDGGNSHFSVTLSCRRLLRSTGSGSARIALLLAGVGA